MVHVGGREADPSCLEMRLQVEPFCQRKLLEVALFQETRQAVACPSFLGSCFQAVPWGVIPQGVPSQERHREAGPSCLEKHQGVALFQGVALSSPVRHQMVT